MLINRGVFDIKTIFRGLNIPIYKDNTAARYSYFYNKNPDTGMAASL